ncbi:MAG: class 1 fructose-bisphosphatase [Cytophagales bacterium]|nr:MAG: class 1 fructose-bisphosphatase [Cytophagales bacterium]
MKNYITLNSYLEQNLQQHQDLIITLQTLAEAGKQINSLVNRAGLNDITGAAGEQNVQGEEQQKLDVIADNTFIKALQESKVVAAIISEEQDEIIHSPSSNAQLLVAIDPLDGSSNIDVNIPVGTIFSIHQRISPNGATITEKDFFQEGKKQIAAGYILYGSSTMLVLTIKKGLEGFTLNPDEGIFYLTHPQMKTPTEGKIYSCNEGNKLDFPLPYQKYIEQCQEKKYATRYIGSLVADFHRNLLKGGIYLYPPTAKNPEGKLRLLYECSPLALLAQQAEGKATNGEKEVLEIVPQKLHQRCPLIIGSQGMVNQLQQLQLDTVNS